MEDLKGKKAIITGGSRGIGRATAIAFAKKGIAVGITGQNENTLKETVAELNKLGVNATYAAFDVSSYKAVQKGMASIIQDLGGVDILMNNAGIGNFAPFNEMEVSEWTRMIEVNVLGVYYATKVVLPHLIANKEGDIINISSTAGLSGNANTSAYSASKFAVIGMSQALTKEVRKDNIRVSTLTPSTIATDMTLDLGITDGNPDKVLQPEDFAELITAGLKLPRIAMLANASIWSTNP
ncbi:3-ketoacyl-ACP reductase [Zobellia nedashkovskayae]